jgi:hypothetical protein
VPEVLVVQAGQLGDPVAFVILMESDNGALHGVARSGRSSLPFGVPPG